MSTIKVGSGKVQRDSSGLALPLPVNKEGGVRDRVLIWEGGH